MKIIGVVLLVWGLSAYAMREEISHEIKQVLEQEIYKHYDPDPAFEQFIQKQSSAYQPELIGPDHPLGLSTLGDFVWYLYARYTDHLFEQQVKKKRCLYGCTIFLGTLLLVSSGLQTLLWTLYKPH